MALEFIGLNLPLLPQLTVTTGKLWGRKWQSTRFEKSTKNNNIELREINDKVEIKFEVNKELECK